MVVLKFYIFFHTRNKINIAMTAFLYVIGPSKPPIKIGITIKKIIIKAWAVTTTL